MNETYETLVERVLAAYQNNQALNIQGASSKTSYGGVARGEPLSLANNQGIVDYDPSELVIVARSGTPLSEVQATLRDRGQMLGFEPPFADQGATLGGAIASGLSGSGRPYRGAVRDFLLGTKLINGRGEITQFGGRVMKNVAGFDLFRPMAGAMGTLGVLLEASLRVVPIPDSEISIEFKNPDMADAIQMLCQLAYELPSLSASGWYQGNIRLRLSGSHPLLERDRKLLQDRHSLHEIDPDYWQQLSEFRHKIFNTDSQEIIAAIDLPPATPTIGIPGEQLVDWGGARRYLKSSQSIESIREIIEPLGGSATALKGGDREAFFHPLKPELLLVHQRLKQAFDPRGILNPGRLYAQL